MLILVTVKEQKKHLQYKCLPFSLQASLRLDLLQYILPRLKPDCNHVKLVSTLPPVLHDTVIFTQFQNGY